MADVLVPIGKHLFQPADLQKALSAIEPEAVGPLGVGLRAALDTTGAHVAVRYSVKDGAVVVRGAFAFDWASQGFVVGADLTLKL